MSSTNPGPAITTGTNTTGGSSPMQVGSSSSSLVGFYGATPIAQGSFIAAQSINMMSVSGMVGFTSAASMSSLIGKVNSIAALLASIGLTAAA